jgi:hypothetical protein
MSSRRTRPIWQQPSRGRCEPLDGRAQRLRERVGPASSARTAERNGHSMLRRLRPRCSSAPSRRSTAAAQPLGRTPVAIVHALRPLGGSPHVRRPRGGLAGHFQRRHIEAPTFYASLLAERLHTHESSERRAIPVRLRRRQRFQSSCMAMRPWPCRHLPDHDDLPLRTLRRRASLGGLSLQDAVLPLCYKQTTLLTSLSHHPTFLKHSPSTRSAHSPPCAPLRSGSS